MQKNVQLASDVFIEDLGTGFSYVNIDREKKSVETENSIIEVTIAREQYLVKNPATRDRIIDTIVKENYRDGKNEAALRKGILNVNDPDFVDFNTFAESVKQKVSNEGI